MKHHIVKLLAIVGFLLAVSPASACLLDFQDTPNVTADFMDRRSYEMNFGLITLNAHYIDDTFDIVHALPVGRKLGEAWITFDFIGDFFDAHGAFFGFAWDFREFVTISHDRLDWRPLGTNGEVDNGSYRLDLLSWLPASAWAENELLLTLKVDNPLGAGDVFLQRTTFCANTVPIPGAVWLLSSGLAVFGISKRMRRKDGHAV